MTWAGKVRGLSGGLSGCSSRGFIPGFSRGFLPGFIQGLLRGFIRGFYPGCLSGVFMRPFLLSGAGSCRPRFLLMKVLSLVFLDVVKSTCTTHARTHTGEQRNNGEMTYTKWHPAGAPVEWRLADGMFIAFGVPPLERAIGFGGMAFTAHPHVDPSTVGRRCRRFNTSSG